MVDLTSRGFSAYTLPCHHPHIWNHFPLPPVALRTTATSVYLMVDDATVSLEDRGVRLGHPDRRFGGQLLLMLPDARIVCVPGCAAEVAVVDEEQAGAQEKHEKHRYPMALIQRHKADAHSCTEFTLPSWWQARSNSAVTPSSSSARLSVSI